ncbi:MAG TPA: Gfo/Idh/MocA family oxidoreductase [Terriglobia bacterium]|nr:Gfo/Idh/MocA family oxidoreductase [Terriglobia bacterium]
MARSVGVGVIGMGWMGTVHSRSYLAAADRFRDSGVAPRLVICADDVEPRARQAQAQFGFARSTTRWQEVIADPEVEVVNIAAPNHLHLAMVKGAAAAGKHIFCEKPVGRFPRETAEIERAAREAGVLTFVGYNYRWCPVVQYAHQLIRDGRLGRLSHFRGRFLEGYASNPQGVLSWRFQREFAGLGVMGDLLSHIVDMSLMLAGPVKRVVGNRETFFPRRPLATPGAGTHFSVGGGGPLGDVTNEDYVGALVEFANGVHGTLEACRVIQGHKCQLAFEVEGTEGALAWDFERMNELKVFLPDGDGAHDGYTRLLTGPEHPFHARFNPGGGAGLGYEDLKTIEAHEFLRSIAAGRQAQPGFGEALRVAEVLGAIERTWETGSWQEVGAINLG